MTQDLWSLLITSELIEKTRVSNVSGTGWLLTHAAGLT